MSRWMKLANAKSRWARVRIESRNPRSETMFIGPDGSPVTSTTFIKSTLDTGYGALNKRYGCDDAIAEAILNGDPEIKIETVGRSAGRTERVLLDPDGNALYAALPQEIVFAPDGTEIERREPALADGYIDPEDRKSVV